MRRVWFKKHRENSMCVISRHHFLSGYGIHKFRKKKRWYVSEWEQQQQWRRQSMRKSSEEKKMMKRQTQRLLLTQYFIRIMHSTYNSGSMHLSEKRFSLPHFIFVLFSLFITYTKGHYYSFVYPLSGKDTVEEDNTARGLSAREKRKSATIFFIIIITPLVLVTVREEKKCSA